MYDADAKLFCLLNHESVFTHVAIIYSNLLEQKNVLQKKNSHKIYLGHQHGAVSLFWDTNMAALTSCENTLQFLDVLVAVSSLDLKVSFIRATRRPQERLLKKYRLNKENERQLRNWITLFCILLCPFLHDYDVKMPLVILRFMEIVNKQRRNFISILNLDMVP